MTQQTFPLAPVRSGYATCTQTQRNNLYYEGQTVSITLSNSNPTGYSVRDWYGTVVASGAVSGTTLNLGSAWDPGWYRVYLTGASNDSLYGFSYGATSFGILRADVRFQTLPATTKDVFGQLVPYGNGGANLGDPIETVTKGCLGIGTSRFVFTNTFDLEAGSPANFNKLSDMVLCQQSVNSYWLNPTYLDPVRPRKQWLAFDTATCDTLRLEPNYLDIALKDGTIDGSKVFISATAGGGAGGTDRIKVYYPDSSTVVETYDCATPTAAKAAINAASNYIFVWNFLLNAHPDTIGPTAMGTLIRDAVVDVVSTMYALGTTHFEGPYNEPSLSTGLGTPTAAAVISHRMKVFTDYVHQGHPNAKAMGPCTVDIVNPLWEQYLDAVVDPIDGWTPDAISFHSYNDFTNGDINLGRNTIENFLGWLKERGLENTELWQTEAHFSQVAQSSLGRPRAARNVMLHTELWEQYGVVSERNNYWYDYSHGFWSAPMWLFNGYFGDHSPNPQAVTLAVRAQETFGKNFHHRIDFGSVPANNIFIGNVYGDAADGSVALILMTSAIPNASVTLTVHGTTNALVVVDAFGNESTVSQTSGRVTVDTLDLPVYVRLPAGVNVSVYSVNDWGPTPLVSLSAIKTSSSIGGVGSAVIGDDSFLSVYDGTSNPGMANGGALPAEAIIYFPSDIAVDRVIIWAGAAWQSMCALFEYDIDTWDGASWTTRKTVNKTRPSTFLHGSDSSNWGCQRETYWDEQWIEDVKLDAPVTCSGIRIAARAASWGAGPDEEGSVYAGFAIGQGSTATPYLTIQEISVISPTAYVAPAEYSTLMLSHSPVGYWKFDEPSGTTSTDSSGNGLDGGYAGSFSLGTNGLVNDGGSSFYSGAGGLSNGGWFKTHNSLLNLGDGPFTIACWFESTYSTFADQIKYLFTKGDLHFRVTGAAFPGTTATLRLVKNGGSTVATSSETMVVGTRYFCVVTKNGATTKLYLNGQDVTTAGTNVTFSNNTNDCSLAFNGDHIEDNLAVLKTVLSAAEVLALYVAGSAPATPVNTVVPTVYS